ncbi:MAG: CDP-diacylglycerol--glycerol-3-phosphate 3-phosphatidyltransferase [Planctomycetota bacterium]
MKPESIFAHWPNRVTALRFAGSLVLFLVLALVDERAPADWMLTTAFWLFIAVALSDVLDGWIARRWNVVTVFGRIADPFCDKVLILGSMIFLATLEFSRPWLPAWIVVVVLAREFLVTGIRGYVESQGLAFGADGFGKIKMLSQSLAVGFILGIFAFDWPAGLGRVVEVSAHVLVWITLASSLGSGWNYVAKTRRLLAESS